MLGFSYKKGELFCEELAVSKIAKELKTPLYIYSKLGIEKSFLSFKEAFKDIDSIICFSVKSCPNVSVLKTMSDLGCGFDIVSSGELVRVIKAKGDTRKIVYSGVGKTIEEISMALENKILMFNVESEEELLTIEKIASEKNLKVDVSLRINPDVDAKTHAKTTTGKLENKFGIDLKTCERLANYLKKSQVLRLNGVSLHIGSPVNDESCYTDAIKKASSFVLSHRSKESPLEYFDVGGGFGLLYRDETVPDFSTYAKAIVPYVKDLNCKLILEPGRSLIGNNSIIVTKVLYTKDNGTKLFTIADLAMNDLIRPAIYDSYHFVWPTKSDVLPPSKLFESDEAGEYLKQEESDQTNSISPKTDTKGNFLMDVVGPICETADCLCQARRLPKMQSGDFLVVFSVGAYGFSMSSTYNGRPRAAEVLVDKDSYRIIRKRETMDYLLSLESL